MALRSLSRHAASLTAMPLRPLGQRSFAVVTVTSEDEFTSTVKASPKAVAYYTAAWCGPCRMIAPKIDEMGANYPDIPILKVDIDEHESLASEAGIRAVPTFQFLHDGKKVDEVQGADEASIEHAVGRLSASY